MKLTRQEFLTILGPSPLECHRVPLRSRRARSPRPRRPARSRRRQPAPIQSPLKPQERCRSRRAARI